MLTQVSAEEIRRYVQNRIIEPARRRGERIIVIRAGDVHDEMGLKNQQPLVCDVLRSKILQRQCNVQLIDERWGKRVHQPHARNIWFTYRILYDEGET